MILSCFTEIFIDVYNMLIQYFLVSENDDNVRM